MTDNPAHADNSPPTEGTPTPDVPTLDELREKADELGDAIAAHFEELRRR